MAALPDTATLETALDMAARAPSAQNAQPWHWQISRDAVHLYADRSHQLGDTDADRRDVLLGCGAVLSGLVRTAVGPFSLAESVKCDEITDIGAALIPDEKVLARLPRG